MSARHLRGWGFGAAAGAGLVFWLLAFACPGKLAPWHPAHELALPLADFASNTATLQADADGLRVRSLAPEQIADLSIAIGDVDAAGFRYLSYTIEDVARTRKTIFFWEGDEGRGFATLPDALGRGGVVDLARLPAWKGRVRQIGFALVPVDYVPPEALTATDVWIGEVALTSMSWKGAVTALWSEWSAARAWTGRSNNTAGFDFVGSRGPSMLAFVAGALALILLLTYAFFGRGAARRIALPLVVAATGLLAVEQLRQHAARASTVLAATSALPDTDEIALSAHPPLAADARALLQRLHESDRRPRIWVQGSAGFFSEYPVWLLREQDVGALAGPLPTPALLAGNLLVLVGSGDWEFDAGATRVRIGSEWRDARPYFEGSLMKAYRFGSDQEVGP